jgi:hypothetical protein
VVELTFSRFNILTDQYTVASSTLATLDMQASNFLTSGAAVLAAFEAVAEASSATGGVVPKVKFARYTMEVALSNVSEIAGAQSKISGALRTGQADFKGVKAKYKE